MKKIFTFAMLALLGFTVEASAQSALRKTWDFREGFSSKTVNALKADQEEFGADKYWRNYEGDATKADDQHFWNASKEAKNADGFACTHNGGMEKVIPELDGLVLGMSNAKKFVITYNGAQAANEFESEGGPALGEMIPHGKSYVWLNGKNETIKFQAEVNQKIRIGIESHAVARNKLGEARGISLTASTGTLNPNFEGNPVPTYYTEYEWELTGTAGEIADLTIKSTNGCHIYFIIVGEGDDPNANKTKVGYLTAGNAQEEEAYLALVANEDNKVEVIDPASLTMDVMNAYDVTVVSPALPADNASVATLKSAIAFRPILNLNANLYAAWGLGEAAASQMNIGMLTSMKHDLLYGLEEGTDYEPVDSVYALGVTTNETFDGVKLGEYFGADDVVMTDGSEDNVVAIHAHNLFLNGYVYMPFNGATEAMAKILANAVSSLKASKSEVVKAPAPKIKFEYKNLATKVTMAMAASSYKMSRIYYTTDGTEPTEASTLFTDTLTVTEPTTFKAVCVADGYLLSDVAEAEAQIYRQPLTPVIELAYEEGKTLVNILCADSSVYTLWYNFAETNDTTKSMKFTEPFTVTAPTTVTAFAVVGGMVFSELATLRATVRNPKVRIDKIGLFDANAADWQKGGSGSTIYYFTWGKNSSSIYDMTQDPVSYTVDPETEDTVYVYPEKDYEYYVPAVREDATEPEWEVKSKGQVMIWQSLTVGSDPGNEGGYNPETAGDILSYAKITNNDIQFGGKTSGERCTGAIQSRVKFAGPFDVVTYIGTSAGGSNVGKMLIEVSADSINWTAVGDTMATSTVKRLWKSYVRSYEGTDEVYVRIKQAGGGASVQIYNMYIMNEGEESLIKKAEYEAEYAAGITEAQQARRQQAAGIYTLDGVRVSQMRRGLNIVLSGDGKARKVLVK